MRLTYELEHKGSGEYDTNNTKDMPANNIWKAINKLGQLEDIEDELGIELITLAKALKNGIYVKRKNMFDEWYLYFTKVSVASFSYTYKAIYVEEDYEYQYEYLLTDYGKTWSLTKEELL